MQTQIRPCRGEFFLKINKRACTSIRHTRVFEDFKFKILEGSEQYWSCPGSGLKSKQIWYPLHNVCTLGWVLFTPTLFKYWIFTFGNILNFSKFLHFRKYFEEFIGKLYSNIEFLLSENNWIFTFGNTLNFSKFLHFRKYFEEFIGKLLSRTFPKFDFFHKPFHWPFYRIGIDISPLRCINNLTFFISI